MPRVKIKVYGLKLLSRDLEALSRASVAICKYAVFPGAGIAADKLRSAVDALQTVSDEKAMGCWQQRRPSLISVSQKEGLLQSIGITPMRHRGSTVGTKVGFHGYNNVRTRKYPKGQPNIMIAASCDHGSSATIPQPFIRTAYSMCLNPAKEAMSAAAEEFIQRVLSNS